MANIGMKYLKYAILDTDGTSYSEIKTMGGAISSSVTPNFAEASLYSDDALKEYVSSFQSATVSLGLDHDDDQIFAELLGKTIDPITNIVSSSINDIPPYVGFAYIVPQIKNGVGKWRAQFFPKVKFKPFIPEAKTRGDSVEFTAITVEGITIANDSGIWEQHVDVAGEAQALEELENFFTGGDLSAG